MSLFSIFDFGKVRIKMKNLFEVNKKTTSIAVNKKTTSIAVKKKPRSLRITLIF